MSPFHAEEVLGTRRVEAGMLMDSWGLPSLGFGNVASC